MQQRPVTLRHPVLWLVPGLIWCLWLIYASLIPVPGGADLPPDKLLHITAYAVLVYLIGCALRPGCFPLLLVVAVALGMVLEYLQGLTVYRSFEWADGWANMLGAAVGILLLLSPAGRLYQRIESWRYE